MGIQIYESERTEEKTAGYAEEDGSSFVRDYVVTEDEDFAHYLRQLPAATYRSTRGAIARYCVWDQETGMGPS
jgi:hypothetical protein